jgi:DNA-binding response OmpR family regulator
VVVTALSSQLARFSGLSAGADAFVTKPFSAKLLLQRIQTLLD